MTIATVGELERYYGLSIDSDVELLASAISVMPFQDEEDNIENSKTCSALFKESKSRLLNGDAKVVVQGEDKGDPSIQHRKYRLLDECCKLYLKSIAEDAPLQNIETYKFFLLRSTVEYIEMKKEHGIRPDIWIGVLNDEQEPFQTHSAMLRENLNKASCEDTVDVLENVKKTLLSCTRPKAEFDDAGHATQAALHSVNQLGSHPFLSHLMSVDKHYIPQVGSRLTGIPASWLYSSLNPPSPREFLSKKFFGQEHAIAAVDNILHFARDKDGRPLGVLLFHDPNTLYWEEFAKDISCWLYGTVELRLRLDLSANVDTLLSSANGKGKLCELFDYVKTRPFSVVVLEKVDQAHDSVIEAVYACLTGGCTLEGTSVDFSRTVIILVSNNGSCDMYHKNCPALPPLFNHSRRRLMDLASNNCGRNNMCVCTRILRQVKDRLSTKIWDLLDDVVLFASMAVCNVMAYARIILREIADSFCGGRLIIYPSEAALYAAYFHSDLGKGEKDVKRWLELNVVPTLQQMVDRNDIDEKSIVFIDTFFGTKDLSYRVGKVDDYLGDDITKNFSKFADAWGAMYQKGKVLEDNITSLRKRLADLCTVINPNVKAEAIPTAAMQELIELVDNAIGSANDISNSTKKVLGCSVDKADGQPSVSKKAKIGVESLRATVTSHSARPEMIKVVKEAFLRKIDASEGSKTSPSSYLLLGLEDDGKRELLVELERNFGDAGIHLLKVNLSNYSNDDLLSNMPSCSPGSLSDAYGWLHLVKTVKEHPYSILFFDNVEKANMSIFSLLMSLFVHGVSADGEGNVVDFGRTVIIFASDVGNKHVMAKFVRQSLKERKNGGLDGGQEDLISSSQRQGQVGCRFRSELVYKVDEVVIFDPFAHEQLKSLARIPITTEILEGEHINTLTSELTCLFDLRNDVKYRPEFNCFSRLLKRVIREGTANVV